VGRRRPGRRHAGPAGRPARDDLLPDVLVHRVHAAGAVDDHEPGELGQRPVPEVVRGQVRQPLGADAAGGQPGVRVLGRHLQVDRQVRGGQQAEHPAQQVLVARADRPGGRVVAGRRAVGDDDPGTVQRRHDPLGPVAVPHERGHQVGEVGAEQVHVVVQAGPAGERGEHAPDRRRSVGGLDPAQRTEPGQPTGQQPRLRRLAGPVEAGETDQKTVRH